MRWRLSLPVYTHPMTGRPVLVLSCTPFSETHGEARAWDHTGQLVALVVNLHELAQAPHVAMVEDRTGPPAGKAMIFDAHGRVVTSPEGHA